MIFEFLLNLERRQRLFILITAIILYWLLVFVWMALEDPVLARSFALLVILLGGLLFGMRGGISTAVLLIIASTMLALGRPNYFPIENPVTALFTSAIGLILGGTAGYLVDQAEHINRELQLRKQIEAQLKEHEQRYQGFFNQINDGIFVIDLDWQIVAVNKQACQLLGYTHDELLATRLTTLFANNLSDESIKQVLDDTDPVLEQVLISKNGKAILVELNVQRITDESQKTVEIQFVARDTRGRKHAEADHLKLEAERQRGYILNQFMRDASHDFRTPLSVINTSIYLLNRDPDPDNIRQRTEIIQRQVKHIDELLDNMMVMMRLDEHQEIETEPVEINDILQKVFEKLYTATQNASIDFHLELEPNLPAVQASASWLEIAINRIVHNAIQFTPAGGKIRICSQLKPDRIEILLEDTGVGIAEEDLPHIFESFYRVDKARSSESGGSGLGLTIAQKIVHQHHGQIRVDSKVDHGSRFTILLPLTENSVTT